MHFKLRPPTVTLRSFAEVWDFGMLLLATSSTCAKSFIEIQGGAKNGEIGSRFLFGIERTQRNLS